MLNVMFIVVFQDQNSMKSISPLTKRMQIVCSFNPLVPLSVEIIVFLLGMEGQKHTAGMHLAPVCQIVVTVMKVAWFMSWLMHTPVE